MPCSVKSKSLPPLDARDALLGGSCQALSEGSELGRSDRLVNCIEPASPCRIVLMASRKTEISLFNLL